MKYYYVYLIAFLAYALPTASAIAGSVEVTLNQNKVPSVSAEAEITIRQMCCSIRAGDAIVQVQNISDYGMEGIIGQFDFDVRVTASDEDLDYYCISARSFTVMMGSGIKRLTPCVAPNKEDIDRYNITIKGSAIITANLTNTKTKDITVNKTFMISSLGSNFIDVNVKFTIPRKSTCTVTVPSKVVIQDVNQKELESISAGQSTGKESILPINVQCTSSETAKLSFSTDSVDSGCIGTDLAGYAICIEDVDMKTNVTDKIIKTNSPVEFKLRAGRGAAKPNAGEGMARMQVFVEPE